MFLSTIRIVIPVAAEPLLQTNEAMRHQESMLFYSTHRDSEEREREESSKFSLGSTSFKSVT